MNNLQLNSLLNRMTVLSIFLLFLATAGVFAQEDRSPISEGRYLLKNVATGKFLTITGAKYTNGTVLTQNNYSKDFSQQFYVSYSDDNKSLRICAAVSEELLISVNGSAALNASGATIKLVEDDRSLSQAQWKFIPTARPRIFNIMSLDNTSKQAIGVTSSTATQIVQGKLQAADIRFQWEFIPVVEAGWYLLKNVGSGLVMNIKQAAKANGTPLIQTAADTEDGENNPTTTKFEVLEVSAGVYNLTPGHTYNKKWVSVSSGNNSNGTGLTIASNNDPLQGFDIKFVSDLTKGFDNETFVIRSTSSQKLVGVKDGSDNIIQWDANEKDTDFQWRLISVEPVDYLQEGTYMIQNVDSKLMMDVAGAKLQDGTNVIQWGKSGASNQRFEVQITDDCKYQLLPIIAKGTKYVSVGSKLSLGNTSPTTLLDAIYAGEGIIENEENESNIYELKSQLLSLGVTGKSNGSAIIAQNVANKSDSFKWRFIPTEEESYLATGLYTIQNVNTGLMMDVAGGLSANGSKIIQYVRSNANNQKFEVSLNERGEYNIAPVYAPTKLLSVTGGTATNRNANGTELFIGDGNKTNANVSWELENLMDEESKEDNIFAIRSLDPSSKKSLGINSIVDRKVVQSDGDVETNTRLQWRFIPTTKSTSNARVSSESLSETQSGTVLTVMPNPLRGDFDVYIDQFDANEQLNMSIVDLLGKPVYQKEIGTERRINLNTDNLNMRTGSYLIEVNNGLKRHTAKIVVIN